MKLSKCLWAAIWGADPPPECALVCYKIKL